MAEFVTWLAVAVGAFLSIVCLRFAYEDWRDNRDR